MSAADLTVGTEVEAQCGKCHDATMHVVLAIDKGRARCRCLTCDAEHLYRKPRGAEAARTRGVGRKADPEVVFNKAMSAAGTVTAVKYVVSVSLEPGQKISHKKFGEGVVMAVPREDIVEVIFKDGVRKLVMNR